MTPTRGSLPPAMRVYPSRPAGVSRALAEDAPVLIDGLQVQFDQQVALAPIALTPPGKRRDNARDR